MRRAGSRDAELLGYAVLAVDSRCPSWGKTAATRHGRGRSIFSPGFVSVKSGRPHGASIGRGFNTFPLRLGKTELEIDFWMIENVGFLHLGVMHVLTQVTIEAGQDTMIVIGPPLVAEMAWGGCESKTVRFVE